METSMRKKPGGILLLLLLLPAGLRTPSGAAQEVTSVPQSQEITIRTSTDLVLVNVVALNAKSGFPDKTLKRDDFQVFDDDRPVSIKTFDSGASTRPLVLWFVVQCSMRDYDAKGSGLFRGRISQFKPALKDLDSLDTVAVAHWCDDGESRLDLLPTSNVGDAVTVLEQVLAPTFHPEDHKRTGELALQKTLRLIVDATRSAHPEPLPVVIFLYGDFSGMQRSEADHFIGALLETSAITFGLRDRRSPRRLFAIGEQKEVAHYIATQTGGQYSDVTPGTYAKGLQEIVQQLHFRYELGFKPEVLDGKRHNLRVELTNAVKNQHKGVRLRHRAAYVAVPVR
jgi:hypothetical protein